MTAHLTKTITRNPEESRERILHAARLEFAHCGTVPQLPLAVPTLSLQDRSASAAGAAETTVVQLSTHALTCWLLCHPS